MNMDTCPRALLLFARLRDVGVECLEFAPDFQYSDIRAELKQVHLNLHESRERERSLSDELKGAHETSISCQEMNMQLQSEKKVWQQQSLVLQTQYDALREQHNDAMDELRQLRAKCCSIDLLQYKHDQLVLELSIANENKQTTASIDDAVLKCKYDSLSEQHHDAIDELRGLRTKCSAMDLMQYKHSQLELELTTERASTTSLREQLASLQSSSALYDELMLRYTDVSSKCNDALQVIKHFETKEVERTHNSSLLGKTLEDEVESFLRSRFGRIAHIERNVDYHGDFMLTFDSDNDPTRIMIECKSKLDPTTSYLRGDRDVDKFMRDMAVSHADYGILFGNFRIPGSLDHVVKDTYAMVAHGDVQLLGDIILKSLGRVYAQKQLASSLANLPIHGKPELAAFIAALIETISSLSEKHFDIHAVTLGVKRDCKQQASALEDLARVLCTANATLVPSNTSELVTQSLSERKRKRQ